MKITKFFTGDGGGLKSMVAAFKSAVLPANMDEWVRILSGGGGTNTSNETITPRTAMQIAAFYSCVRVISEDTAKVPLAFYKRMDDGSRQVWPSHPLYSLFNEAANGWQSGFDFREMQQALLLLRGNSYSLKVRSLAAGQLSDGKGQIVELVPILPDRVRLKIKTDGTPYFMVEPPLNQPGAAREFQYEDIYYERGLTLDGYTGVTPITYQAELLGFALAQTKYGGMMMSRGARPGGVLEHPGKLGDKARDNLRESWESMYGGTNAGRTAILEEGMKWQQLSMKNVDMQYLESMKLNRSQIAALMRVPPHKIGDLDKATFSNIEHQSIEYVTDCLFGWCKRRETSIRTQLIDAPNTYYAEHGLDALMRGDTKARYEAYAIARQWGWFSVNDIRRRENENSIGTSGDVYLQPLNMVPAGTDITQVSDATKAKLKEFATELGKLQELAKMFPPT